MSARPALSLALSTKKLIHGPAVPGDPSRLIKGKIANTVAAKGPVRKIEGRLLVDSGLFPDGP